MRYFKSWHHLIHSIVLSVVMLLNHGCTVAQNEVTTHGRSIWVNDEPFFIKGICYHPVNKGETHRIFDHLDQDLELMSEAGINTIRVYSPIDDESVLDRIHTKGMKIIMGMGYNEEGRYDIRSGSFAQYIRKYKNHPAILFWELGNEYNYHPEWFEGDITNWYNALRKAIDTIHEIDVDHPVATAHGEIPDSLAMAMIQNIDLWGLNVYRWDQPQTAIEEWLKLSDKPMYFSELGADSYMKKSVADLSEGVNEKAQARANQTILDSVLQHSNDVCGLAVFSFTDGWWKAGNPNQQDVGGWAPNSSGVPYDGAPNEEFWGIVDIERNKKLTYDVLKSRFLKTIIKPKGK